MKESDLILFIQNYLSRLVSYEDDDNFMNFSSYVEMCLKLNYKEAILLSLHIISILMRINILTFVYSENINNEDIDDYIMSLIIHSKKASVGSGWFDYYKPTALCVKMVDKYQLYDGYYDNSVINVDFIKEIKLKANEKIYLTNSKRSTDNEISEKDIINYFKEQAWFDKLPDLSMLSKIKNL